MLRAELGPCFQEGLMALDVDLGRDLDELDVEHAHARVGHALLGFAHHGLVGHKVVPGRRGRDRDETKPHELKAGSRRHADHGTVRWASEKAVVIPGSPSSVWPGCWS